MTKRLFTLAAPAVLAIFCAPQMHAAVATELVMTDGTTTMTIGIDSTGAVTENTCVPASGCGANGVPHGTLGTGIGGLTLGMFNLSVTSKGGGSSTLPTLMDLVEIDAESTSGPGTLTVSFTDSSYASMTNPLDIGETYTPDSGIAGSSSITFNVCTNGANTVQACPTGTNISSKTLTAPSTGTSPFSATNPNATGSLETQTVMHFGGVGDIQSTFTISNVAVPEPAAVFLLGTLIIGLTALFRKQRTQRS